MRRWIPPELLLVAALVSGCTFVGMLLFGPELPRPSRTLPDAPSLSQTPQRPPFGTRVRDLWAAGQIERATEDATRRAERRPTDPETLLFRALGLERLTNPDDPAGIAAVDTAWRALRAAAEPTGPVPGNDYFLAWALLRTGEPARAADLFAKAGERSLGFGDYYNAACYLAMAGRTDDALAAFSAAVDAGLRIDLAWAAVDPDLDPLRHEPRFLAALARAAQPTAQTTDQSTDQPTPAPASADN
jgi:tetratricopeptide (TPR) repeat protein